MTNNEFMISFLQSYLDFANDTNNNPYGYSNTDGLCDALYDFAYNQKNILGTTYNDLHCMLKWEFKIRINNFSSFPFGEDDYNERAMGGTQHECPKRIAFVKQYLDKLKGI